MKMIKADGDLLLSCDVKSKAGKKYRDQIIRNELLQVMELAVKTGARVLNDTTKTLKEKREDYFTLFYNLEQFAMQNPEEDISKEILQVLYPEKEKKTSDLLKKIDETVTIEERVEGFEVISNMPQKQNGMSDQRKEPNGFKTNDTLGGQDLNDSEGR